METQKVQLKKLFESLGYNVERSSEIVEGLFAADDDETTLPIENILQQAQEYAKPLLRTSLKREFSHEFKGQYMGEAINKIVAASKGKIRRANYEDGNVERALADLVGLLERGAESESGEATVNELKEQLAALALEKEQAITEIRNEFGEKENARLVYDTLLGKLGALQQQGEGKVNKRLSVDQQHAAKAILRELGDEFLLRYDEDARDIAIYSKNNPTERVSDNGKAVNVNELVEKSLVRNNWIAQSNGGSAGTQQFLNRPVHGVPQKQVTEGSEFRKRLEAHVKE